MKLYAWRGDTPNFGDQLNTLLWPSLLPDFFDEDDTEIVLGIGSVLDRRHGPDRLKIVLGAGYGGYEPLPQINPSWVLHWVRGPLTARLVGVDPARGIGDPAMLWPFCAAAHTQIDQLPEELSESRIGFMPHFESIARGAWIEAAAAAGLHLIDPRADPRDVVAEITRCRLLVSEAMHGAIIADTLRVPWIAVEPQAAIHRAKWHDWAGALAMKIRFQHLPPSSLYEWASVSRLGTQRPISQVVEQVAGGLRRFGSSRLLERAANALRRVATEPGQLSEPDALQRCQEHMLTCLDAVRRYPRELCPHATAGSAQIAHRRPLALAR